MAQLDSQAPVVADDTATGGDSGAAQQNTAPTDQQEGQEEEFDTSAFYADDQPKPKEGEEQEGEGEGEADKPKEGEDDLGDPDDLDGEEDQAKPIDPPASWKDEDKAVFAQLPKEAQEVIARREGERDKYIRGVKQEHQQAQQKIIATAQEQLAEIHTRKAQEFQQLAAQLMPQPPDERLLYTGNPQDGVAYQQQRAAFERAQAQQQELLHRADAEKQQAQTLAQAQEQQAAVADLRSLAEKQPDWFEEGTLNLKGEIISQLEPIGEALGYPPELMAQANSRDLTALHVAHEWKAKADKWDGLQKKRMEAVRAAKGKAPNLARPGAARGGNQATDDPLKLLYPND